MNGKKVLVVDDEPDLRQLIVMEFESQGAKCLEASGGKEALEVIKKEAFDLIVSDVRMPEGDGLELLEWVKELNPKHPPFMLVTGFADVSHDEAVRRGASGLFTKPINWEQLVEKCREFFVESGS